MNTMTAVENLKMKGAPSLASDAGPSYYFGLQVGRRPQPGDFNPFRVYLREHTMADCGPYCEWQTDPEVMKFSDRPVCSRQEAVAHLVESVAQQVTSERRKYFMAVVLRDTDEMIGDVGLTLSDRGSADIGWFLRRPYWGRGYATEAALQLIHYAMVELNLTKIFASCHRENKASERIMIKCGFKLFTSSPTRLFYLLERWN
jgi:ribosomal-protein-alanine N-acetyltransferase